MRRSRFWVLSSAAAAYLALEQFVRLKLLILILDHRYFFGTSAYASRKMGDDDDDVEAGAGAGAVYRALTPQFPVFASALPYLWI